MKTHNCRFCGQHEPHNGTICLGCNSFIGNCRPHIKPRTERCSHCDSYRTQLLDSDGHCECRDCQHNWVTARVG